MPRVSIVLTCFNHLRHLQVALDSVLAQTFQDFEVIALDDGSTDGTREYLESFKRDHPHLDMKLVFNERNLGTYGTLNRGLETATGEFVAELNDDDVWAPTKLERQVAHMDECPEVGLVHTSGRFIDQEGNEIKDNPLGFPWPVTGVVDRSSRPSAGQVRRAHGDPLYELAHYNRIIASSVLVRRECFQKVGAFNTEYFGSGDWEMWFRIAEDYEIGYVNEPLTFYRVHPGSASHNTHKIAVDDLKIREWMLPRLFEKHNNRWGQRDFRLLVAHQWACIGSGRVLSGNRQKGRRAFIESLKAYPLRFKSVVRWLATFLPQGAFRLLDR